VPLAQRLHERLVIERAAAKLFDKLLDRKSLAVLVNVPCKPVAKRLEIAGSE
jgi:hypothetical protein